MDIVSIAISVIVFVLSFGFFVLSMAKKPTEKHTLEIEEASKEIIRQIQDATEESVARIEEKIVQLETKQAKWEERFEKQRQMWEKQERVQAESKVLAKVKEAKKPPVSSLEKLPFAAEWKDEKMKRIHERHEAGDTVTQIAKDMGMNTGEVQVYVNLSQMNRIG